MTTIKQQPSILSLDMSTHTLNTSSSKQKFSFPKSSRFSNTRRSICDSYYEIPSTKTRRGTSFGYGEKDIGIRDDKLIPPVASYNLESDFTPEKGTRRGVTFGTSRDKMVMGGPLATSLLQKYIPGPGNYKDKSTLTRDQNVTTLKSRLPDRSCNHLLKNPGPGQYAYEELGNSNYYVTSNHPKKAGFKMAPSRLEPIHRSVDIGPGHYNTIQTDLNPNGRYVLSNNEGSKTRYFDKQPRKGLEHKHMLSTPGAKYALFSEFG